MGDPYLKTQESLHEVQLRLQQARRDEAQQRFETRLLMDALGVMAKPSAPQALFEQLNHIFRDALGMTASFALLKSPKGHFKTIASTDPRFEDVVWTGGNMFERVIHGATVPCFDVWAVPEWQNAFDTPLDGVCSGLHFGLRTEQSAVLIAVLHTERGFFTRQHANLIDRFSPLATQAILKLESQAQAEHNLQLTQQNEETQRALVLMEKTAKALRERQESEEKYSNLFQHSNDTIILHDLEGRILDINPEGIRQFGYERETILSLSMKDLHPASSLAASKQAFEAIMTEGSVSFEVDFVRQNGEVFTAEVSSSRFELSGRSVVQGLVRDITDRLQNQRELKATTTRLTSLLKSMRSGVMVEDEHRKIVLANDFFCEMFSIPLSPEQLSGVDCRGFAEQSSALFNDPVSFAHRVEVLLEERTVVSKEEIRMADGRILERDYIPIFIHDDYRGHLWQYRDVTDRFRTLADLADSESLKSAILDTALDGIITIDKRGTIIEWNPGAERIFGHIREEVIGLPMHDVIVPHEMRDHHTNGMKHYLKTGHGPVLGQRLELEALHKDGRRFPCEVSINAFEISGEKMFTGYIRDITASKKAHEALESAKEEAEAASQAKSNFLAVMSHEMRTPLNAILGMTELLMGTPLEGEQGDYLDTLQGSAESLLQLINDLLDLSKIEAGEMTLEEEPFDLRRVVERVTRLLRVRAQDKGIRLKSLIETDLPDTLLGDEKSVRQVLVNLIGNAIKFTLKGHVRVTVESEVNPKEHRAQIRISVEDTGVGIAEKHLERIFESFYQTDSSTRRSFGGTGLGLNISKRLIGMMGGEIGVESTLGRGSCFHVALSLPIVQQHKNQTAAHPRPARSRTGGFKRLHTEVRRRQNVLLVEDIPANSKMVRRFLEEAGYNVDEAKNGQIAYEKTCETRYNVVLMDLQMPVVDGFDATVLIRQHEREHGLEPVPIIALTAHAVGGYRERCLEVGMNDYMTKPVHRASLLKMVDGWLFPLPDVLIVDDVEQMRELVARFLTHAEPLCRVVQATGGAQACDIVQAKVPNAVLLDIEMPDMNGFETLTALRAIPGMAHVPIVALTGHDNPTLHTQCLESGFMGVLVKPVPISDLRHCVKSLLFQEMPQPPLPTPPEPPLEAESDQIFIDVDHSLSDLVPGFLKSCKQTVSALQGQLEKGDYNAIRLAGHGLKGTAAPYGFAALGRMGQALEAAAEVQSRDDIERITTQMTRHLARVVLRQPDPSH